MFDFRKRIGSLIKNTAASGIGSVVDLDNLIRRRCDRYILSYHRVLYAEEAEKQGVHHALWITPETLAAQISWMKEIGDIVDYHTVLHTASETKEPLFAITFDDGWKDNYTNALPILKHHQVPALVFLATEAVETGAMLWTEDVAVKTQRKLADGHGSLVKAALNECRPYQNPAEMGDRNISDCVQLWIEELKQLGDTERHKLIDRYFVLLGAGRSPLQGYMLDWDEAREMKRNNISFGSHTHRHLILEDLPLEQVKDELLRSKALIADKLQIEVDSFCYPNGRYSGNEGELLSAFGYRYGFRLDNVPLSDCTDLHYIPRILVSQRKAANEAHFKLGLLQAPLYRSKAHVPKMEKL